MDEEQNLALNQNEGEETLGDTSPVSEQETIEEVEETKEESEQLPDESEETKTETSEDIKKRNANQRIRELSAKAKAAEAKAFSLAERLEQLTGSKEPSDYDNPYIPQVTPGSEISPDQYKQDVMRTADSLVNLRLKQQEAVGRIKSESQEVLRKYPELDPDNESFNKDLSDDVYEAVETLIKNAPYSASVGSFVDKLMKPYKSALDKEIGKSTEKLAKQVSESALKPTSMKTVERRPDEKSIEELEKELGIIQA